MKTDMAGFELCLTEQRLFYLSLRDAGRGAAQLLLHQTHFSCWFLGWAVLDYSWSTHLAFSPLVFFAFGVGKANKNKLIWNQSQVSSRTKIRVWYYTSTRKQRSSFCPATKQNNCWEGWIDINNFTKKGIDTGNTYLSLGLTDSIWGWSRTCW